MAVHKYYKELNVIVIIIGLLSKWGSGFPSDQKYDQTLDDDFRRNLVFSLDETKHEVAELKTMIVYNLQSFCSRLPIACGDFGDFFLPSFNPPLLNLTMHADEATLPIFKCFLKNVTKILSTYNNAFERSGNRLQLESHRYNRLLQTMIRLTLTFTDYLNLNLGNSACIDTILQEFVIRNEGQQYKTLKIYGNQLIIIATGLQYFIDGFSSQL